MIKFLEMIETRLTQEIGCRRDEVRAIIRKLEICGTVFETEPIFPRLLSCVRQVVFLRVAGIGMDRITSLWETERKLIELIHGDSHGSPTWLVDGWAEKGKAGQRLFLTHYAIGTDLRGLAVQQGLNFAPTLPELFDGTAMGDDAIRVLQNYQNRHESIVSLINKSHPLLNETTKWAKRF